MSVPDTLFLGRSAGRLTSVYLGKTACMELFDYLLPRLQQMDRDVADPFEGAFYGGVLGFTSLPQRYFRQVYQWVREAAEVSPWILLKLPELKTAFETDPRYALQDNHVPAAT